MPNIDLDKWPPLLQMAAFIGALLAGGGAWFWAAFGKARPSEHPNDQALELLRERNQELQSEIDDAKLRDDLAKVVEAARTSLQNEMRRLETRIHDLELQVAKHFHNQ